MATKAVATKGGPIVLPELKRAVFKAYVIGESPLIVHAWSKKAYAEMLIKQMGQKLPKFPRSPVEDFLSSIYHCDDGAYAFPATGIKRALVSSCTSMNKEISKVAAQQAFYIKAEQGNSQSALGGIETPMQLVRIYSPNPPRMREDATRIGPSKVANLAYRAEFWPWAMVLEVVYNSKVVTAQTCAALIDTAGFAVGLGEWRQERSGTYGTFRLADESEQKMIDSWVKMKRKEPVLPDEKAFVQQMLDAVRRYGEAPAEEAEASADATVAAVAKSRAGNGGKHQPAQKG